MVMVGLFFVILAPLSGVNSSEDPSVFERDKRRFPTFDPCANVFLMLIVCHGPDTFRALQKARELELAFKQKYDAHGLSVERLASGKDAVTEIASRAGAI